MWVHIYIMIIYRHSIEQAFKYVRVNRWQIGIKCSLHLPNEWQFLSN